MSGRNHLHSIFRSRHCNGRPKFITLLTTNLIIMPPSHMYSAFVAVILVTLNIRAASSSYRVHSTIIKNLIAEFEAHQHSRNSQEQKLLVEKINQIQITR